MTVTEPIGGLRTRLVWDSLLLAVEAGLAEQGWFDAGRAHIPVNIVSVPHEADGQQPTNTLVLTNQAVRYDWVETGSQLMDKAMVLRFDFWAENDSLGVQLMNDVRDILRGRLTTAVSPGGAFAILDLRMATPSQISYGVLTDVVLTRKLPTTSNERERHVFTVTCTAIDTYAGEYVDSPPAPPMPGDSVTDSAGTQLVDEAGAQVIYA